MAWRETVVKKILGLMFVLATSLALVGAAGATGTTYDKGKQGKYENYKPKHSRADYKLAFKTHLNGANEVPPVKTDTTGKTAFLVNQDYSKMKFVLKVYGGESIFGAAGAHIHCGLRDQNGPVLVFLAGMLPGGLYGNVKVKGTLTDANVIVPADADGKATPTVCGKVTINTLHDVVQAMKDGYAYVNVHSTGYPAGVVRGQIYSMSVNYAYKIIHTKAYRYYKHMTRAKRNSHGDKG